MEDLNKHGINNLLDWTKISDNPLDKKVRQAMLAKILNAGHKKYDLALNDYMLSSIKNKRVLDIGLCEHDFSHVNSVNWKHRQIKNAAKYCLGIDIIPKIISFLKNQGYNVKLCDATSSEYLGEKFDIVYIGDVIEHVNDPVKLLQFAARHLHRQGKIIVTTPNPFYFGYVYRLLRQKTYLANAEHVCWITPSNALEIGRRANVNLYKIVFTLKNSTKAILAKILPIEFIQSYYIYEFVLVD
jgi:2-polyprenyl-3-methyl-5-hydroxy-6-metoxy-1,4-benzoquinol methylase